VQGGGLNGHLCDFWPVGKRISREHFFESMKFIYALFILLLALMTSAQCQQTAKDWCNNGVVLNNQGKYDDAINAFDEAIRLDPNDAKAWYNKGKTLNAQGKYDEAIQACDEAIWLDPKLVWAWYNKGIAFDNLGKYDDAIKAYDEAIRLDPNNKGFALKADASYAKAKELGHSG
jgi:tetratricopeptide (TPR) repeat protein